MSGEVRSSVDDIWNSMKSVDSDMQKEYRLRAKSSHNSSVTATMDLLEQKQKGTAKGKSKKSKKNDLAVKSKDHKVFDTQNTVSVDNVTEVEERPREKKTITSQEFVQKISRDLNSAEAPDAKERIRALSHILTLLRVDYSMTVADYNDLLSDICRPLFKRYADSSEKCRDLAFRISIFLFENAADFVPILGYFIPALLQRAPATLAYDAEMQVWHLAACNRPTLDNAATTDILVLAVLDLVQVFVWDTESHDAYRRGRAVDRQDRTDVTQPATHIVVESSEEVRLLTCTALTTLIRRVGDIGAQSVLNPYFSDVVLFLQAQVRDPFPDLKIDALRALEYLAGQREYEDGMCYFAVALVRAIMPSFRHRHAKVRSPAVDALRACVHVPNRAKRKGAGTDAICELVGFKEDNILQVAAFYKTEVSINYLAEITSDASVVVRERVAVMLSSFLTELEDRYDHQTRLLPYLLDLLGDENIDIQRISLMCLTKCGQQYEEEHSDEIIERRQYGIDGDDRCNLEKPLPAPFTERPRIGIRIYVRGNTKRFLFALVGELTNWQSKTRLKSAKLLKYIIILCEEYLTMEAHRLIPAYIKALGFAREDKDKELEALLCEICELSGRYTAPESYVHYILPRLRGDVDITQFGIDSTTRCCVMTALRCMLDGSKVALIPPLLPELIDVIVDPYVIDIESLNVHCNAIDLMNTLLAKVQGRGLAATEAHFQTTGRLKSMRDSITKAFRFLFLSLHKQETRSSASDGLTFLSALDFDTRVLGVPGLFARQVPAVLSSNIAAAGSDDDFELYALGTPEYNILELSVKCPWIVVQQSTTLLTTLLRYALRSVMKITSHRLGKISNIGGLVITDASGSSTQDGIDNVEAFLMGYSELLLSALKPSLRLGDVYYRNLLQSSAVGATQNIELDLKRDLYHAFVLNDHWAHSAALQTRRLEVLELLFDLHDDKDSDSDDAASAIKSLLNGKIATLFQNVFTSTSVASTPVHVRLASAKLVKRVLAACSSEDTRVMSYEKQSTVAATGSGASDILKDVVNSTAVLKLLMNITLDDSCDDIRVLTLESMLYVVPFILRSDDKEFTKRNIVPGDDTNAVVAASYTFEGAVDRLIHRAVEGNPTPHFLEVLDTVLRSLAVLSPSDFEGIVRGNFKLLTDAHKAPSAASDMFSGLVDHCDMMTQLNCLR